MGVDAIFTFESSFADHSPYIHTTEDTMEHIDMEHVAEFSKVILGYAVELGQWEGT
jgi:leucyl aminopeptidase